MKIYVVFFVHFFVLYLSFQRLFKKRLVKKVHFFPILPPPYENMWLRLWRRFYYIWKWSFHVSFLYFLQLDVWKEPSKPGNNADIHVPQSACASVELMLKVNNIPYVVMVKDLEDLVETERISNTKNAFSSSFQYDKYNSWNDVSITSQSRSQGLLPFWYFWKARGPGNKAVQPISKEVKS